MESGKTRFTLLARRPMMLLGASCFTYTSNIHDCSTRKAASGDIFVERKNTRQYGIKSVRYAGTKSWNTIPIQIRRSPSISNFRSNFLKFLLSGCSS